MKRVTGIIATTVAMAAIVMAGTSAFAVPKAQPFYLKPGDRVVFYGDSITDQRLYTTYIETFCVSRFPNAHYTFVHSGWGGDRVTGGGGGPVETRIKRDILAYKPTVVTICLGMNDGSYRAFDQNIFNTYVNGYRHIIDTLLKEVPGVRITLLTASAYDDVTRAPGFLGGYNATLVTYGEAVRALGKEYGLVVADTNGPLVAALARAHSADAPLSVQILRDRVHPGPGGHLVMAAALLNAWNAPTTVASVEINAESAKVASASNTRISGLTVKNGALAFTESDLALPWPFDRDTNRNPDARLVLQVTDIETLYNKYLLVVKGLNSPSYKLAIDGKDAGTFTAQQLAAGVDLAEIDGTPVTAQSQELLAATRKHNDIHFRRWRQVQVTNQSDGLNPSSDVLTTMTQLDADEAVAVRDQEKLAQPQAHRVTVTPVG